MTNSEEFFTSQHSCYLLWEASVQFSSVQSLSRVQLFATPWTAACHASLSITNSQSLRKLMSIESVMPANRLIICHPLLLPPSIIPSIGVFSNESVLRTRWPKYCSFSFSISPSRSWNIHNGWVKQLEENWTNSHLVNYRGPKKMSGGLPGLTHAPPRVAYPTEDRNWKKAPFAIVWICQWKEPRRIQWNKCNQTGRAGERIDWEFDMYILLYLK